MKADVVDALINGIEALVEEYDATSEELMAALTFLLWME